MAIELRTNTDRIVASSATFDTFVEKLRGIVRNVADQSAEAAAGLRVEGMSTFQRTISLWNQELDELQRDLRLINETNQQVAQTTRNANARTGDVAGGFTF